LTARNTTLCALLTFLVALSLAAVPARAGGEGDIARLIAALRVGDTVAVMRREGIAYGTDLARDMLPEAGAPGWQARLERLYDAGRLERTVEDRLARELEGIEPGPLIAFFTAPLGARIVALELSARDAFLDPDIEAAARARHAELADAGARVVAQIDTLIDDSDLVGRNVSGALNASLMLYRGLTDGGALEMTENEILRDVRAQEPRVREDSEAWLGAYLLTAYAPLAEDEIEAYIALWRTTEGRALNRALFAAFDGIYEELSYLTGRALAEHMRGQDL